MCKVKKITVRVIKLWNRLPRETVDSLSLETVRSQLDQTLRNLI